MHNNMHNNNNMHDNNDHNDMHNNNNMHDNAYLTYELQLFSLLFPCWCINKRPTFDYQVPSGNDYQVAYGIITIT